MSTTFELSFTQSHWWINHQQTQLVNPTLLSWIISYNAKRNEVWYAFWWRYIQFLAVNMNGCSARLSCESLTRVMLFGRWSSLSLSMWLFVTDSVDLGTTTNDDRKQIARMSRQSTENHTASSTVGLTTRRSRPVSFLCRPLMSFKWFYNCHQADCFNTRILSLFVKKISYESIIMKFFGWLRPGN